MQMKLPETLGSAYWSMRTLAMESNAIDMSLGISEFHCPGRLSELAASLIRDHFNNIEPPEGHLLLREKVAQQYFAQYGRLYSPETEVTICAGPVQAVTTAISAVVNEGDEVIIAEPSPVTYGPAVRLNGGTPVFLPLKEPNYRIDWEDFRKIITSRTRMIILNTPHKPTGNVYGREDMLQLQRLTNGTGIYVVSDEEFEYLAYDQDKHQSAGQFDQLAARSFIISSPGPLFHINGWNLAWCLAPAALMAEFRKIHEYQVFSVAFPFQGALGHFLDTDGTNEDITEFYQGKRNYFNRLLKGTPYILQPAQGTYYQLINFSNLSREPDQEFALRLLREAGVAAMPLSLFMHKKRNTSCLRFCFAKKNETLEEVAGRLIEFAGKIKTAGK